MRIFWLEARPWNYETGAEEVVRACSVSLSAATMINGAPAFLDVLADGPTVSTQVFDGAFTGRVNATGGSVPLAAGQGDIDYWAALAWADRSVKIWTADVEDASAMPAFAGLTLIWDGVAESYKPGAKQAIINLAVTKPSGKLARLSYAGTGGREGRAEIAGAVKPYAAGVLLNRACVLLDSGKGLYQVHGYGLVQAISTLREGYRTLDQVRVAQPSAADLVAAVVPATEIHTFAAEGLFRIGFTPLSDITADFSGANSGGFSARPGALIKRALLQTGWPLVKIDTASLDAIDAALPFDAWLADETGTDISDRLDEFCRDIGGYWDVTELGVFYAGIVKRQAATLTIGEAGDLKDADIFDLDQLATQAPFWKNRVGYAFNPRTFTAAELGILDAATTADWSAITGPGKPTTYRIRARGFSAALPGGDTHPGLWNEDTQQQIAGFGIMYVVCHQRPDLTWGVDVFDTLSNPTEMRDFHPTPLTARNAMALRLEQIQDAFSGTALVVYSYDEPATGRLEEGIAAQMYRAGASRAVFGGASFPFRGAYALVGVTNAGEGNGAEYLAGVGDLSRAFIDIAFQSVGGVLTIAGKTVSQAADLTFADGITIEALKPADGGATRNVNRGNWAGAVAYALGDFFLYEGNSYTTTIAHTSDAGAPPPNANTQLFVSGGPAGVSTARPLLYKRSATAPAGIAGVLRYTFATGAITEVDGGALNGWTRIPPASDGNPLWVTGATASSSGATDDIAAAEWAASVILVTDGAPGGGGAPGINTATIYLFKRTGTLTPPAVPSGTLTYTFAGAGLAGSLDAWTTTLLSSGGQYRWLITATALGSGATDTIATGEWASPALLSEDGAPGADALVVALTPPAVAISSNPIGVENTGQLPFTLQARVTRNAAEVTGSSTYGWAITGGTGTDLGGGAYRVDVMTADAATVTVTATQSGQQAVSKAVLTKVRDGSPAATVRDLGVNVTNSGTAVLASSLTLGVGPNGTTTCSCYIAYGIDSPFLGATDTRQLGQFFYRTTPGSGTWVSMGSQIAGTFSTRAADIGPGEPADIVEGVLSFSQAVAGPTSPANWEFGLFLAKGGSAVPGGGGSMSVTFTP